MTDLLARLKQRKLVQWALAYIAAAFALLQGIDIVANKFGWPESAERILIIVLCIGFFVALVLAWYHGERGAQRVSGIELLILALLFAIGGGVLWQLVPQSQPVSAASAAKAAAQPTATIPGKSIAVLPFENLSDDKQNEYFVSGMQDLILTKLADIGELKVISRTSTLQYGSRPQNLKQIGAELGVATLLEGSVQRQGKDVLINVQLIDAKTDAHLWAQSYPRTLDNVFGVEGEVAGKVADALKAKLSPAETDQLATALSGNPAANDSFLRAEYFARRGEINQDTVQLKQALALFQQALANAPDFALAHARLSLAQSELAWYGGYENVLQLRADARAHAERALQLASSMPEAQLALGYCDYYGAGNYVRALDAFVAVLKLRPNDAEALAARGYVQRRLGRFDAAIASLRAAQLRDPRNTKLAQTLGASLMMLGNWPEAESALRQALAFDPGNVQAKFYLANAILFAHGDVQAALAEAAGDAPLLRLQRVTLLTYQRRYREALTLLESVPDTADSFSNANSSTSKKLLQANLYHLLGDEATARDFWAQELPLAQARLHTVGSVILNEAGVWTGIASAQLGLGRVAESLAALQQSQTLIAQGQDHLVGPLQSEFNAAVYARAGRADLAVPLLDAALSTSIGMFYSPVLLWLDPAWDPIRASPQFQALLQKYAADKPAVVPVVPATDDGKAHG